MSTNWRARVRRLRSLMQASLLEIAISLAVIAVVLAVAALAALMF